MRILYYKSYQLDLDFLMSGRFPNLTDAMENFIRQHNSDLGNKAIISIVLDRFMQKHNIVKVDDIVDTWESEKHLSYPSDLDRRTWVFMQNVLKYRNLLASLPADEFFRHRDEEYGKDGGARLLRDLQADEERFFHGSGARANWDSWLNLPAWTDEEAVALSLEKEPSIVNSQSLNNIKDRNHSPFIRDFERRLDTVNRGISIGDLPSPFSPRQFIDWVTGHELFDLPPQMAAENGLNTNWRAQCEELQRRINELEATLTNLKASANNVDVDSLEAMAARPRLSLSKLAYGLAYLHHHHKPQKREPFDPAGINAHGIMKKLELFPDCLIDHENISQRLKEASTLILEKTKKVK